MTTLNPPFNLHHWSEGWLEDGSPIPFKSTPSSPKSKKRALVDVFCLSLSLSRWFHTSTSNHLSFFRVNGLFQMHGIKTLENITMSNFLNGYRVALGKKLSPPRCVKTGSKYGMILSVFVLKDDAHFNMQSILILSLFGFH